MNKILTEKNTGERFERVSKWIHVRQDYKRKIYKNNILYDWCYDENGNHPVSDEFNPSNGVYLNWFLYKGRLFSIDSFYKLNNGFFFDGDNRKYLDDDTTLTCVDVTDYYNPYYTELKEDNNGYLCIRLYQKVQ